MKYPQGRPIIVPGLTLRCTASTPISKPIGPTEREKGAPAAADIRSIMYQAKVHTTIERIIRRVRGPLFFFVNFMKP
jgi:hypothetical protein